MFALIKKLPWWVWVGLIIAFLFLWQSLSGWSYSNKLFNMVKDQVVTDEKKIIDDLEKDNLANQKEKADLYGQLNSLKNQRADLQKEGDRLKNRIKELEDAKDKIVVPSDPDALVDLLHKLGLKGVRRGK